jgi:hypothetical protein
MKQHEDKKYSNFSWYVFWLWIIIFWPIAVLYYCRVK